MWCEHDVRVGYRGRAKCSRVAKFMVDGVPHCIQHRNQEVRKGRGIVIERIPSEQ